MRTICVMNHKGGVGKTTTAVNLAAGLSRQDQKVILIDLDPQSNVSISLNAHSEYTLYDALKGGIPLKRCVINIGKNLDIINSKENLAKAEYYLANQPNSRLLLKDMLATIEGYDFMIIDCPPSLGILNQNVLAFCKEIFVPTSTDFLGLDALAKMNAIVRRVNQSYNHSIRMTKIVPTLYDKRTKICRQSLIDMQKAYPGIVAEPIRYNSKVKEAPGHGKSIFRYARSSIGAKDYGKLAEDVLEMGAIRVTQEIVQ
jgi:chromosome partitioning protein